MQIYNTNLINKFDLFIALNDNHLFDTLTKWVRHADS